MSSSPRVGYVLKVYPRFSETFILNELLAHERADLDLEIFSLRRPADGRFHEGVARVRTPVTYIDPLGTRPAPLWEELRAANAELPAFPERLAEALDQAPEDVHQATALARAVRARGVTHLHAHFGSLATTVARLAANFAGITYSFTAHAKDIFHKSVDNVDLARKLADASAAVTVSDYNAEVLRELCPEADVRRIYNGIELEAFPYSEPAERPARVVAVGRLVEKKGFDQLVDAVAILRAADRALHCDIVGAGELETELAARIERLELGDRVRLLGPRTQAEVREIVAGAAVCAVPCRVGTDGNRDGLPTVLIEAMALGTPCVSTPVTGIPEIVRHEHTGLLVPEGDPAALASALERLLAEPSLRTRLARAARGLIESSFDVDGNTAAVRAVFARAAGRPSAEEHEPGADRLLLR